MKISLTVLGEIKVDYYVDGLDVNSSSEEIRSYQVPGSTIAKLMKYAVSIRLLHLRVNVVARVAQLRNLLSKELDSIYRIAKDNALVDFQL
mmetsp:Transcript_9416/g.17061  ORF Transcript_9416/g.17061 Transcript_9416/m.17061 type:complete len:91 (-) Transcript_9416:1416-1688(-)